MKVDIYPAGVLKVGVWVLQWQSVFMLTPAFKYYKTEKEAEAAGEQMRQRKK